MSSEEIIDPTAMTETVSKRTLLHLVVPLILTVLTVGAIAWVGISSYRTTSDGVLKLTHELMEAVQHYIGQEVADYIMPASAGDLVASGMIEQAPPQLRDKVFYSYSTTMLRKIPQLQSFYLADDEGNFILVARTKQKDVLDCIRLVTKGGHEFFEHTQYNAQGVKVGTYDKDAGVYDPRTRPWYKNTQGTSDIKWTEPYFFPTDGQLVMTSSLRFKADDGHTLVFATNISLNELSSYLKSIQIGRNGSAIIVDSDGKIIAARDMATISQGQPWTPQSRVLSPSNYPVFSLGYDHYRVRGFGAKHVEWDGKPYITMASELPHYSAGWILLIAVPEKDFASFARQSSWQSLKFAGIIIVFSGFLGGLFIRQVRRTDRGTRALAAQKLQIIHESAAVQQVAVAPSLFEPTVEPLVLTEQLARVTQARRASLWRFLHDGAGMICEDSYDSTQNAHTGGFEVGRTELEQFFAVVEEGSVLEVPNAAVDERTTRFERLVMREIGTRMLAVYPITSARGVEGMLALEDARTQPYQQYFMSLMAAVAGIRFSAQAKVEAQFEPQEAASGATDGAVAPLLSDNLLMQAPELDALRGAGVYPSVAVLVITFSDPVVDSAQDVTDLLALINQMAIEVKTIAEEKQLFAVELAGHRMICMAGCTAKPDPEALTRLADAALKMREAFIGALAAADLEPVFTMGIDYGPAFGGALGTEGHVFNLWGQTVSLAELMAEGASDPGIIQVTERVYATLRDRYLFRSRGTFFAPHLGVGRAYTLAARR